MVMHVLGKAMKEADEGTYPRYDVQALIGSNHMGGGRGADNAAAV